MPDSPIPVTDLQVQESRADSLGGGERSRGEIAAQWPLLAALLLLQYSDSLHGVFRGLGRFQGIPVTAAFLGVVTALLLLPPAAVRSGRGLARLIEWTVLGAFSATTTWTYLRGSLAIGKPGWMVLAAAAGLAAVGFFRRESGWMYAGAAVLIVTVSYGQIAAHPFDEIFKPGRPIWNIRHAVERLLGGTWVYQYHYGLSLGYLPTLFLPYLPFGVLHIDLRWTSVTCMLILLAMLYWQTRRGTSMASAGMAAMVLISAPVMYAALTAQVAVYWCYLLLFAVGLARGNAKLEQAGLICSILARQLAWPMALPWLVSAARRLRGMRLGIVEGAAMAVTTACVAVSPRGFLWSVFVLASADANKGSAAMPQPVSAIALTPLLPFARHSVLVLGVQLMVALALVGVLYRNGFLQARPLRACVLVYMAFLSLNVRLLLGGRYRAGAGGGAVRRAGDSEAR
jgi:hypothetical protein